MSALAARLALVAVLLGLVPAAVRGDSFDPVRMQLRLANVARIHRPLGIRVSVSADAGVLDPRSGAIQVRVKLAQTICGGDFASTVGTVLLDRRLRPQPHTGVAYAGRAKGKGRPSSYGVHPVCIFITDDYKQFASDTTDFTVNVSKPCSLAAARYDKARKHHRSGVAPLRRKARKACGRGVPL